MKTHHEIMEYIDDCAKSKVQRRSSVLLIQAIMAGIFVALGAIGYFRLIAYTSDPDLGKFLGAVVFPTGIIAILLLGSELFTSDCMSIISVYKKDVRLGRVIRMLIIVLCGNFIGALFMSLLTFGAGSFSPSMMEVVIESALFKTTMPLSEMFLSAILCNIIVCSGVMMSYSAKSVTGKILAIWFPIVIFVLSGAEHIVANMFYLITAFINGANISIVEILTSFGVVTLGNFIGGAIIITGAHYLINKGMSNE